MKKVTDSKVRAIEYLLGDGLLPRGFKSGPLGLYRSAGDRVDSLTTIHGKYPGEDRATLTVTVSVGFKSFARFMKDAPPYGLGVFHATRPMLHGCNLGTLDPAVRAMKEWPVTPETSVTTLGRRVLHDIEVFALPFFEDFPTIEKVVAAWAGNATRASREALLTAAVHWFQGDRDKARDFADARIRELTPLVKDLGGDPRFTWTCFMQYLESKGLEKRRQ